MNLTWGVTTTAALVDSINPCAISVLLLTVGFLFNLQKQKGFIVKAGLVYVLGIFLTYLFIGLGVLRALSLFGFPHILARVGAVVLSLTALINMAGAIWPKFPIRLGIPHGAHSKLAIYIQRATIPSLFVLGILVGLFEFPCTGGPYLLILGLLHDRATFMQGLVYLIYYNLIFVSPLVVILFAASRPGVLDKVDAWRKANSKRADIITGIIMLVLAAVIFATS